MSEFIIGFLNVSRCCDIAHAKHLVKAVFGIVSHLLTKRAETSNRHTESMAYCFEGCEPHR